MTEKTTEFENMSHFEIVNALAEQGDVASQFRLGELYYNGVGVRKNKTKALRWWTNAAEQGHPHAQYWVDRATKEMGSKKLENKND